MAQLDQHISDVLPFRVSVDICSSLQIIAVSGSACFSQQCLFSSCSYVESLLVSSRHLPDHYTTRLTEKT